MNKTLDICDQLMFVSLLAMIVVLPYSLALIEIFQVTMMVAWALKSFLPVRSPLPTNYRFGGLKLFSCGMGWSLIAIAILIAVTIPCSHFPALSFKKLGTRFLQQILLMYLVTEIVHNRRRLYSVLAVLLLTFFPVAMDAMFQFIWGKSIIVHHADIVFGRITGPMSHPNDFGTLLVTVLPVVLMLIFTCRSWITLLPGFCKISGEGKSWLGIILISVLFLSLAIALGLTSSRGAWVAFAVSMVALGLLLKNYKSIILIVLILGIFFWLFDMHSLSERSDIYNIPKMNGAVINSSLANPFGLPSGYNAFKLFFNPDGRETYWNTAMGVIGHYPWIGCGYSAYMRTLSDLNVGHEEYPHNSILHITAELGLLGLILYGWFFTALYLQIKNVLSKVSLERDLLLLGYGLSAGILGWFVHSLMDTAWGSLQLSDLWWLFIGILLSLVFVLQNSKGDKLCH